MPILVELRKFNQLGNGLDAVFWHNTDSWLRENRLNKIVDFIQLVIYVLRLRQSVREERIDHIHIQQDVVQI